MVIRYLRSIGPVVLFMALGCLGERVLAEESAQNAALTATTATPSTGRTFYVDPEKGDPKNDGSAANPWRTLAEVFRARLVRTQEASGKPRNPNAPVGPGDTILLRSGYHGDVTLTNAYNEQVITVAAEKGQTPRLGRLAVHDAARWTFRGLTISPSFMEKPYTGTMAQLAEGGPGSELVLEDCFLYSVLDVSAWTAKDWMDRPAQGILLGRHGTKLTARNNHVLNTRFGINLCSPDSLCEGNIVENFSADGIRVTRDGITVQYNVIKNVYVSAKDGDDNHDDGIQCFLFNVGTGTVRRVTVRGNLIVNREDPNQPFQNNMQGIGFFDGPLVDFVVEDNVVDTSHWHAVSLYDAQNCLVQNNVAYTEWLDERPRPWVLLGSKTNQAHGNRVLNNLAFSFDFKADKDVVAENNKKVTKEAYLKRRHELEVLLANRFGSTHALSGRKRVDAQPDKPVAAAAVPAATAGTATPAPPPVPVCTPEVLAEWRQRLRSRVQAVADEKKRKLRFEQAALKSFVTIRSMTADGAMVVALDEGGRMDMTWLQLDPRDHLNLALVLAGGDVEEDHALAAFFLMQDKQVRRAEDHLAKAGELEKRVRESFTQP